MSVDRILVSNYGSSEVNSLDLSGTLPVLKCPSIKTQQGPIDLPYTTHLTLVRN